ncbi:MAG: tetratricopeptide repeat protein [Pyrinomonadaceae bacterium]
MLIRPQGETRNAGARRRRAAGLWLTIALLLGGVICVRGQDKVLPPTSRPGRVINIQGQVSLAEGGPSGRALVTLTNRGGVPRQTYTTEQGRFEFPELPEGDYTLMARSLSDASLISESVETDTSRTATGNLSVALMLRKEIAAKGEPRPAAVHIAEADQNVPGAARKAFREGIKLRRDNAPDQALARFDRAVELYPGYFQALTERGNLRVLQRKLPEAAADFARALKLNPQYGPALRGTGYCHLERREFTEAISALERAITAQPDDANAYLLLGIANLELDQRAPAKTALIKALGFNSPHELRAHIYLGNLYAREHMFQEAADELRKYLAANPDAPDAAALKAVEAQWRALVPAP